MTRAVEWARTALPGDYLARYSDDGLDDVSDPGSRCGYGDDELDAADAVLSRRDMYLTANDIGIVARLK